MGVLDVHDKSEVRHVRLARDAESCPEVWCPRRSLLIAYLDARVDVDAAGAVKERAHDGETIGALAFDQRPQRSDNKLRTETGLGLLCRELDGPTLETRSSKTRSTASASRRAER